MPELFDNTLPGTVGFAEVALEQGIDTGGGLTYAVPESMADLRVGERVIVPLGRGDKKTAGTVVALSDTCDYPKVKPIISRDEHSVSLPSDLIDLARWMANYYCAPLGMVIANMLPAAVKRGAGRVMRTFVDLAEAPGDLTGLKVSKLQKRVLEVAAELKAAGHERIEIKELADQAGAKSVSPVKQLIEKNIFSTAREATIRSSWQQAEPTAAEPRLALNDDQQRAVQRVADSVDSGFGVHLLHGVTGSGKTEVYLRIIEHIFACAGEGQQDKAGKADGPAKPGVIVLVPEIALTPQTAARFLRRFEGVAVLHSGLTATQRHEHWRRIREGEANIVVGARSAIFAPMPNLKLIIVDEEHDSSYKQDQLPRYHARDVAVKRGHAANVPVVLGSATPSLESYHNAVGRKRYHLLTLPQRAGGMRMPTVRIIDMQEERKSRRGVHLLSQALEQSLQQTIERKGQAILLLNRRGYANYIACPDHGCGWMKSCDHCDATMVYHKDARLPTGGTLRCHHCTAEVLLERLCPLCGKKVTIFGLGTQRVEEEIGRKFPQLRMARMDSDAMRTGQDYFQTLQQFGNGEIDLLVGTQMIAKGLDFPNVKLVGVISGDTSLHMPDFRAAERTFQLIAQVAGRAGRSIGDGSQAPGSVLVQSFNPDDPSIVLASEHDYEGFAKRELELREQMGLPPFGRMARIVIRDRDSIACTKHARQLADHLTAANDALGNPVRLRGPAPCPIARVAEFHRQQIELLAPDAAPIQRLLTALRNAKLLVSDARTAVDVDPVVML